MMKFLIFLIIWLTFIVSIIAFIYIDIIGNIDIELHGSYIFENDISRLYDIAFVAAGTFPFSILLSFMSLKTIINRLWLILIGIIYLFTWLFFSYQLVHTYIHYFGATWSEKETFFFMINESHFYFICFGLLLIGIIGYFLRYTQNKQGI